MNLFQLGVHISEKHGRARKCQCSAHGKEYCDQCSLDLRLINQLLKLQRLEQSVTKEKIESIAELSFSSIEFKEGNTRTGQGYPTECAGLDDPQKTALKYLLEYAKGSESRHDTLPLPISVAINGLCCFSATNAPVAKPGAIEQLSKLSLADEL
jgi:hypothetical protein